MFLPATTWTRAVGLRGRNDRVYTTILVIVDRYTKIAIYIPITKKVRASKLVDLYLEYLIPRFGIPKDIIIDRGSVFTSVL